MKLGDIAHLLRTAAGSIRGILFVEDNHYWCICKRSHLKISDDPSCVLLKESVLSEQ